MSKSRKPLKTARGSKPTRGSTSNRSGSNIENGEQSSTTGGQRKTFWLFAIPLIVCFLGYLWILRNGEQTSDQGNQSSGKLSNKASSAERIRTLEGMNSAQLEQFLQIPVSDAVVVPPEKIDVELWTQQLDRDLDQLHQRWANDAKVEHMIGLAHLRLKRTKLAEPHLRKAVELSPNNPQMRVDLADLLLQLGLDSNAHEVLDEFGAAVSDVQYLVMLAECQTRLGRVTDAEQSLTRASQVAPKNAELWTRLGKSQLQLKKFEAAEQSARNAISLDGAQAEGWLLLGQVSKFLKKTDQARDAMQRWNELSKPKEHHAEGRDFELENSQSMAKVFGSAYRSLGAVYEANSDQVAAAKMYSRSQQACPMDCDILLVQATALRKLGQFAEAAELMRKAVRLQPQNYSYYQNLANLSMEQREPNKAEAALRLACLAMPENGLAHLTLAKFLLLANKPSEAINAAQTAQRLSNSVEAADVLSQALTAAGVQR